MVSQCQIIDGQQGGGVFSEGIVGQVQFCYFMSQGLCFQSFRDFGLFGFYVGMCEMFQEEVDGWCVQVEVQFVQYDVFEVVELLLGEGVVVQGQELFYLWWVYFYL